MQASTLTLNPYLCPSCNAALPTGGGMTNCPKCHAKLSPDSLALQQGPDSGAEERGSATACILIGLLALAVGLYFLINPTVGDGSIANLNALAIGQSLTVAGSVLLGFGIRPR